MTSWREAKEKRREKYYGRLPTHNEVVTAVMRQCSGNKDQRVVKMEKLGLLIAKEDYTRANLTRDEKDAKRVLIDQGHVAWAYKLHYSDGTTEQYEIHYNLNPADRNKLDMNWLLMHDPVMSKPWRWMTPTEEIVWELAIMQEQEAKESL